MRSKCLHTLICSAVFASVVTPSAFAQATQSDKAAEQQNREAGQSDANGATLEVKPGAPTIKTKDIVLERKITPWVRLPRYILQDQKAIWTSPFHTSKANAKWWF